ncbi:glycoside hydrolase family 2, partial [bacterium]|nr:glycoside hydrolase family 2 [bacterium]
MIQKARPVLKSVMLFILFTCLLRCGGEAAKIRIVEDFNTGWKFRLGDAPDGQIPGLDDSSWRDIRLPHDWSIEGAFSESHPATPGGGALPGGVGWYRKRFTLP